MELGLAGLDRVRGVVKSLFRVARIDEVQETKAIKNYLNLTRDKILRKSLKIGKRIFTQFHGKDREKDQKCNYEEC